MSQAQEAEIEITDSELMQLQEIIGGVNQKYMGMQPTPGNLTSMVHEMQDRCREVGLEVDMFLGKRLLTEVFDMEVDDPDGTLPDGVTFRVTARVEERPFDPERMKHDVDKAIADAWWEEWRKKHQTPEVPKAMDEMAQTDGGVVVPRNQNPHGHDH